MKRDEMGYEDMSALRWDEQERITKPLLYL